MYRWKQFGTMIGLSCAARSWMSDAGVSTMSESSQRTHEVVGPRVVNRREFLAFDMTARRAFWFARAWRSDSDCEESGSAKSWRRMVMEANRRASGPDCVAAIRDCKAAVAALPADVLGMMKPREMSS